MAELISRYRDAPQEALYTPPALLYLALNGSASALALALIHLYGWNFGASSPTAVRWTQVLVAGVSAMALFRTSLFTVRAGDKDIGVGPSTFLQIFLQTADRAVDRLGAQARTRRVADLMKGIDYHKASDGLVPYCMELMQNVSDEEQQNLAKAVKALDEEKIDEAIKVRILGLHLMDVVGPGVLEAAVNGLREELKPAAPQAAPAAAK